MRWFVDWNYCAVDVAGLFLSASSAGEARGIVAVIAACIHARLVYAKPARSTLKAPREEKAINAARSDIERKRRKIRA